MEFSEKTGVIGQLWFEFRNDEDFSSFMKYNDLGCPMAYMVSQDLIQELTPIGEELITETFKMFLDLINVTEEEIDTVLSVKDFSSILEYSYNKKENSTPITEE